MRVAPSARANAWEDVADLSATLGMPLDEWQEQALEAAMGERTDGRWASKFVGLSVPRQNGKSQLIVARALAGILLFAEKMIIISAHETDTAREVWKRLIDVVEENPTLEARVTGRMDAVNREYLSFGKGKDRQTIKLKARRASGARGFSADCLLLDEAQILGKSSWGSIVPTMSARPNPQLWLFGTPPTEDDDPFAFSRVRDSSLAKKVRHCWLEWAADEGDDFDDPDVWAKANPAYGVRISYEACADDRSAMDDEQFARERLGMWSVAAKQCIVPLELWERQQVENPAMPHEIGLAIQPGLTTTSVSGAGVLPDGRVLTMWRETMPGVGWVPAFVEERMRQSDVKAVVIDAGAPNASVVIDELRARKIEPTLPKVAEITDAASQYVSGIEDGWLVHGGQPQLTQSLMGSRKRQVKNTGAWTFAAMDESTGDDTQVRSSALAVWGVRSSSVKKPKRKSGGGKVTVL